MVGTEILLICRVSQEDSEQLTVIHCSIFVANGSWTNAKTRRTFLTVGQRGTEISQQLINVAQCGI